MLGEVREVFLHFQSLCHSFSGYHSPIRRPSTSTSHQTNGGAGGKQTFVVDGRTDGRGRRRRRRHRQSGRRGADGPTLGGRIGFL